MVEALAQLAKAKAARVGVDQAEAAVATAREKQKVTKKGKSDGGARGGAFFSGREGRRAQHLCTIPAAFEQLLPRAPRSFSSAFPRTPPSPCISQTLS